MTRTLIKAVAVAGLATWVGACATPTYAVRDNDQAPPPIQPQYPVSKAAAPAAAAPAPTPPAVETPAPPVAYPPSTPPPEAAPAVQSESLPPATVSAPPQSPAQSALPPDYVPPRPAAEAPPPPPPRFQPAPTPPPPRRSEVAPRPAPQARYRAAPPRFVTDGKVVAATGMFRDYEVQKHDHLDAIARDLETTRKVLVDANHLKAPYGLQPGQHLQVPVAKAYVAQGGDTLAAVAKRFSIGAGELADLNNLSPRGRLRAGEKLALPANFHDRGPTRLPTVMIAETPARLPAAPKPAAPTPAYRSYGQAPTSTYVSTPYVPSPEALAAAARLRAATTTRPAPSATTAYPRSTPVYPRPAPGYGSAYAPPRSPEPSPGVTSAVAANAGRGRFIWPVRGEIISPFGVKGVGRRNDGVDVKAPQGSLVRAAAAGEVVYAGDQVPGFGNLVLVKHTDGWVTAYAHLDKVSVQMRQTVTQGQELGQVGQTGGVTEPQLHFEIRFAPTPVDKARPVDPMLLLPK